MKRLFATACTVALAAILSTNAQVRRAESEAPDSTRYNSREPLAQVEHPRRAVQGSEINNPDSVENNNQYVPQKR
ncbi:MAG TPA: hypothetical protein VH083_16935 [Myxococcales bacterium]|jgi:hypothetical protein|nr:hypothetical protein [Myxococcales bacterium]